MKKLYRCCLLSGCAAMLAACSLGDSTGASADVKADGKIEVAIGLPAAISSRTSVADDGVTAVWNKDDRIAVWAENGEGGFAFENETFKLWHYEESYNSALFTARIDPMAEGEYVYYAVCPSPSQSEGTRITYAMPEVQDADSFPDGLDIMVASPQIAAALTEATSNNIPFAFSHKMHMLKIRIPEGGNRFGMPVTRLELEFPAEISGLVSVEATDAGVPAQLSEGTNTLVLESERGLDAGDTFWAAIFPTQLTGKITYTAYNGTMASYRAAIAVDKLAEEGHITPVALAIPRLFRMTTIVLPLGENHLGEAVRTITLLDEAGEVVETFDANDENIYKLEYEGEDFDAERFSERKFKVRFESEHAIVEVPLQMPEIVPYTNVELDTIDVPYLLFEDFSGLQQFDYDGTYSASANSSTSVSGHLLNDKMPVAGWNVARSAGEPGRISINSRYQIGAFVPGNYYGRLDTPAMSALKNGVSVRLKVEYELGVSIPAGYNIRDAKTAYWIIGTHTSSMNNAINGSSSTSGISNLKTSANKADEGAGFTSVLTEYSETLDACGNTTRIVWLARHNTPSTSNSIAANQCYLFYIDNIRVSIANE